VLFRKPGPTPDRVRGRLHTLSGRDHLRLPGGRRRADGAAAGELVVGDQPSSAWQALGTGDFNADGTSDVLWRNTTTGEVDTWIVSNDHVIGGGAIGTLSTAWQPQVIHTG
jgi:hypothetical protein